MYLVYRSRRHAVKGGAGERGDGPEIPGTASQKPFDPGQSGMANRVAGDHSAYVASSFFGPGILRRLAGQRVSTFDGLANGGTRVLRRHIGPLLDLLGLAGEVRVLDERAEPLRVVTLTEVVHPGLVIDAVGDLEEQVQVLGAGG